MRPVIAYDVVRVCLAGVLLLAAGLKGYQLATEPVLGTGLLDSRWFLIAVVEFELFFGLWLLANIWPEWTRRASIGCFAVFAAVSLYKALAGTASCGCFSRLPVSPWYTFALDVVAVLALSQRAAAIANSTSVPFRAYLLRAATVTVAWVSVGLQAFATMSTDQETGMVAQCV